MLAAGKMVRKITLSTALKAILSKATLPTVLDADGLYFLAQDKEMKLPTQCVLTPHHQEAQRILGEEPTLEKCQAYVEERGVTLVLKGAPTFIFHQSEVPLIIPHGDPGMATAGTGDVLTGIIAALLAQGLPPLEGAAVGALLHALSGECAASAETSYSVVATDLIHHLPEAIQKILNF